MANKPDQQVFTENIAGEAIYHLSEVLDHLRRKERYIVDFMRDLNKHLVENVNWDPDNGKIIGNDVGKITIYGIEEDNKVVLEFNTFRRREAWMDDGEVKAALSGMGDFIEMENHRPSLEDWMTQK